MAEGFQSSSGGFGGGFQTAESVGNWTPAMTRHFDRVTQPKPRQGFGGGGSRSDEPRGFANFEGLDKVLAREREKWAALPPVQKCFYREHPEVTAMFDDEVEALRRDLNNISVYNLNAKGHKLEPDDAANQPIQKPLFTFQHAYGDYDELMAGIEENGFVKPSPVQCQMWPILLSGRDCIGIAQTGTGKTLAFLFPAFIHIDRQQIARDDRDGPTCLILTPTRELALQIRQEVKKYHYRNIKSVCLYGGGSRVSQVDLLAKGVEIVIATPGRMNDLVAGGDLHISSVSYLVLDEADRMLDMGFEPQIRSVLGNMRPDRQTVLTSATWPPLVRELASSYMKNPVLTVVGSLDLNVGCVNCTSGREGACQTVEQIIIMTQEEEKRAMLFEFLHKLKDNDKVLVFMAKKSMVDDVASELALQRVVCETLHGGRDQEAREQVLRDFKSGRIRLVLATDLASRGIDVADITHVINFELPQNMEEYVHRVGRTGRAGKKGQSITMVCRRDWRNAQQLIDILEKNDQMVPNELRRMAQRWAEKLASDPSGGRGGGGRGGWAGGGFRGGGSRQRTFAPGFDEFVLPGPPSAGGAGQNSYGNSGNYGSNSSSSRNSSSFGNPSTAAGFGGGNAGFGGGSNANSFGQPTSSQRPPQRPGYDGFSNAYTAGDRDRGGGGNGFSNPVRSSAGFAAAPNTGVVGSSACSPFQGMIGGQAKASSSGGRIGGGIGRGRPV